MVLNARASILALLAVLVVCQSQSAGAEMTWSVCDDAARPVQVQTIQLLPDPPIIGTPASFLVNGISGIGVESGTVDIEVSLGGVQIFAQSEELCAKTTCPITPGAVIVKLVEDLPPIAPPGEYGLRVVARDVSGQELICVDVNFELVLPSSLQSHAARSSSKGTAAAAAGMYHTGLLVGGRKQLPQRQL